MKFDDYQKISGETAIYPGKDSVLGLYYVALGLGEAGEVQGKVKKILRDDDGVISDQKKIDIAKELGDLLWYVAQTCSEIGFSLDTVASMNLSKLQDRKERDVLKGSGDNR